MVAPLFTTFDYSFRPPAVAREAVLRWAAETRCVSADERLIRPAPFGHIEEWCAELCAAAEQRLAREVPPGAGTVLVSHYPLRQDLVHIPRIPRFSPWCGSVRTGDWPVRFGAGRCALPGARRRITRFEAQQPDDQRHTKKGEKIRQPDHRVF